MMDKDEEAFLSIIESERDVNLNESEQVQELLKLHELLSKGRLMQPDELLDLRFHEFVRSQNSHNSYFLVRIPWKGWRYALAGAFVLLLAMVWLQSNPEPGLRESYFKKSSTSQRIDFLHQKSKAGLSPLDLDELEQLLSLEKSANGRMMIMEILDSYSSDESRRKAMIDQITQEYTPSLQMAYLSKVDSWKDRNARGPITELVDRSGVDPMVKSEALKILENLK